MRSKRKPIPNLFSEPIPDELPFILTLEEEVSIMKNEKVHFRNNYEMLFNRLKKECGGEWLPANLYSDYQLLQKINYFLSQQNCIQFTQDEMDEIANNML